jgi:hypothetical protein
METHGHDTARPSSSSRQAAYDRVVVRDGAGKTRQLSRNEFENLPLRERVTHLIGGTAEFFAGAERVSPAEAMKG